MQENRIRNMMGGIFKQLVFLCVDDARNLHAQLHDTSQGGIALLDKNRLVYGAPDYLGIESCYDKIEYQPELSEVKPWDFFTLYTRCCDFCIRAE